MNQQPPFDVARARRWFAVECNNAAWDLLEKAQRTPQEDDKLIDLAHAARVHWSAAGTAIHDQRALNLLAEVYGRLGHAEPALRYAKLCVAAILPAQWPPAYWRMR